MNPNTTILTLCLYLFSLSASSGADVFSNDKTAFVRELESFLSAKDDKEMANLLSRFQSKLNEGAFCESIFDRIVANCNRMAALKMPVKPYFPIFLQTACAWKGACHGSCTYENWQKVYSQMLYSIESRKFKPCADFLVFAVDFFENNALHFEPAGVSWCIRPAEYIVLWEENQPVLKITETRLEAFRKEDTISIENTSGTFYPLTGVWQGEGGTVKWMRIDPASKVVCLLKSYNIDTHKKEYSSDHALLFYPDFFGDKPIPGKFADKLVSNATGDASWPRFISDESIFDIRNVTPGVHYHGGFAMEGLTINGIGAEGHPAYLDVFSNALKRVAYIRSDRFSLRQNGPVSSQDAEIVVYFGDNDSLYHHGLNMKYEPGGKMVFYEGDKSASKSPYYDSYHKVYVFASRVELDMDSGNFTMNPKVPGQGGFGKRLYIESEHFYDKNLYARLQNVATIHPLCLIAKMAYQQGPVLDAEALAKQFHPGFTVANIQSLLFDLEENGFVHFHAVANQVEVLDKVDFYVKAAMEKSDSDLMRFESSHDGTNGVIRSDEKTIELEGVEDFFLHSRPKVGVSPKGKRVILRKDRGLGFDGKIFAGFSILEGDSFDFDYDKFLVNAGAVQSFDLYLPTGSQDKNGQPITSAIGSRIEHTSGILMVNAPANKSGKEEISLFPAFKTTKAAYVYYDLRNEQGTCYVRDSFFFRLNPFVFNRLGNITASGLQFDGMMVSAGIFPDFKEKLVFQEHDKSLGFTTKTPDAGYPAYAKGNFKGNIRLSNSGFTGKGELGYYATTIYSQDFLFKPNQATCTAETFDLKEDFSKSIPRVHGEDVSINWLPKEDSMFITSRSKSFELFNDGSHEIGGMLIYMPGGLKGRGIFKWGDGQMNSDLFAFGSHSVKTEKTDLQIKAFDTGQLALETKNLKGKIDFQEKKGRFSANVQTEVTTMPFNNYITTLNEFEWDLGKKSLSFVARQGQKGWFLSTDAGQDSLQFHGTSATYDFDLGQLDVKGVSQIESADALIIPFQEEVEIRPGGAMTTLEKARIVADARHKYHQILNATVTLHGRDYFEATGQYEYNLPGRPQYIEFKSITGKGKPEGEKTMTSAMTNIPEEVNFYVNEKTRFQGMVYMKSFNPWLDFDGFARMEMPALKQNEWFEVKFRGDYKNLLIACNEPKNQDGNALHNGLFIDIENAFPYSRVLMPLPSVRDRQLFSAKGVVRWEASSDAFVFGDSARILNPLAKGNLLMFNNKKTEVTAEGSFNLCENIREISIRYAGKATTGLDASVLNNPALARTDINLRMTAGFDFALPKSLMKIMLTDFKSAAFDAEPVICSDQQLYRIAIAEWCSKPQKRTDAWTALTTQRIFTLPEEDMPGTLVLGELDLRWNPELQSFVHNSPKTALISMDKESIHQFAEVKAEFHNPSNKDDRIYLLLKSPGGHAYYFHFKKGILHTWSSNELYNKTLEEMKLSNRQIEVKKGSPYELQLTTPDLVEYFRRR